MAMVVIVMAEMVMGMTIINITPGWRVAIVNKCLAKGHECGAELEQRTL